MNSCCLYAENFVKSINLAKMPLQGAKILFSWGSHAAPEFSAHALSIIRTVATPLCISIFVETGFALKHKVENWQARDDRGISGLAQVILQDGAKAISKAAPVVQFCQDMKLIALSEKTLFKVTVIGALADLVSSLTGLVKSGIELVKARNNQIGKELAKCSMNVLGAILSILGVVGVVSGLKIVFVKLLCETMMFGLNFIIE